MKDLMRLCSLATFALAIAALLGACESAKPFDYQSFHKRPGIFTGADGEKVIFRR